MATKEEQPTDQPITGEVATRSLSADFHRYMLARATESAQDRGENVMERQADAILNATAEKDIWDADAGGTIQARDIPECEVEIRSFEPVISNRQDIEGGHGYYISMDATCLGGPEDTLSRMSLQPGQDFVLQTGAPLIMLKVRAFEANGYLPVKALIKSYQTQSGNTVLKLRPVPKRTVQGQTV